ncbi:hypothetical protein Cni_G16704 [Canna indica]|uniref:Uncharacterized protein n=1 Tax=Canna indica TaxID=4628 RepID=A0AAQ3KGH5_9LILI|nr:hypothetical protein Cni_G16704 [Canna indica]
MALGETARLPRLLAILGEMRRGWRSPCGGRNRRRRSLTRVVERHLHPRLLSKDMDVFVLVFETGVWLGWSTGGLWIGKRIEQELEAELDVLVEEGSSLGHASSKLEWSFNPSCCSTPYPDEEPSSTNTSSLASNSCSGWRIYLGGIGFIVSQGMAFGMGNAIAHRAVHAVMGPHTTQHETVVPEAPSSAAPMGNAIGSDACNIHSKAFQSCILVVISSNVSSTWTC